MIPYASQTSSTRNLAALRRNYWRLLITPFSTGGHHGFPYALDNGAWHCFQQGTAFDGPAFLAMLDRYGAGADFVVAPDIVATEGQGPIEAARSLLFSVHWIESELLGRDLKRILFVAQDGMEPSSVRALLADWNQRDPHRVGFAIGGSTPWKESVLRNPKWAALARTYYCHALRVNTRRRLYLAKEFGAVSFDGTSASMFSVNAARIAAWANQAVMFNPSEGAR